MNNLERERADNNNINFGIVLSAYPSLRERERERERKRENNNYADCAETRVRPESIQLLRPSWKVIIGHGGHDSCAAIKSDRDLFDFGG